MARHRIGDILTALRQNQLDRRMNGVLDYNQSEYADDKGPGAVTVGSSGSEIVWNVNSLDGQIDGETVSFAQDDVIVDANTSSDEERIDVIVASPSGDLEAWKADPAPITTTENDDGDEIELVGRQNPRSQPPALADLEGLVLAAVRTPPESSNTSDIDQDDVYDLRRPALDIAGERGQHPLYLPYSSLESGEHNSVGQGLILPPETTLEVVSWGNFWKDEWGTSGPEDGHELRLLDEDHDEIESTDEFWASADNGDDALFSVSNDGDDPEAYQFQLRNESDEDFSWTEDMRALTAVVYYRLI